MGELDIVEMLIQHGADVNIKNKINGTTAVYVAAEKGYVECLELLIPHGADVNSRTFDGKTPVFAATKQGAFECLELLIRHGANINSMDLEGTTPLYTAANEGDVESLELLIRHGADVNSVDIDGTTAVYVAAHEGEFECLELLIRHGADVNSVARDGTTPRYVAAREGQLECLLLLIQDEADVNPEPLHSLLGNTALVTAIENEWAEVVELLIESGADVNNVNIINDQTPLMVAVQSGNLEILALLLTKVSDVNRISNTGSTTLSFAIDVGHAILVDALIDANADFNLLDGIFGITPLHSAVIHGFVDMVEKLLKQSTIAYDYVNPFDDSTAVYLAAKYGDLDILEMLIRRGADVNPNTNPTPVDAPFGTTVLLVAIENYDTDIVELLIESGADVNKDNLNDWLRLQSVDVNSQSESPQQESPFNFCPTVQDLESITGGFSTFRGTFCGV